MSILFFIIIAPAIYWIGKTTYEETIECFFEKEKPKNKCIVIYFPEQKIERSVKNGKS